MERRDFLKTSCNFCLLGAAGVLLPQLIGCSPAAFPVYKTSVVDKRIQVPVSLFDKSAIQLVRPTGWYYDIAVNKRPDNTYQALLLQCTHQENQLTSTGDGYYCSLHGSQFDKKGNVLKGPAERPLEQYKVSVEKENLIIQIPNNNNY